ncbi:MAG: helix-turn-helix domain-containing protein [Candidatus Uhrbacteria bacterium]
MPQPRLNNSNDLIDKISSIGLTEKEAKVYSVLLEMGGAFPSAIAVAAKMNRSTTYKILTSLAVKGLVVEMRRRNRLYYQVERPNKLTRFAKDQISLAEERSDKVKQLLPEIEGLYSVLPSKPRMRFFEGFPEVLSVHEDHVADDEKYEMLAWANADKIAKFLPESLKKGYLRAN